MAYASGYPLQGRMDFQGLGISIENRRGSWRVDKAHNPPRWRTKMKFPYGYIRGTEGVDHDHVDCYIGPYDNAAYAYIVHQVDPSTGKFDEEKVMLGFPSISAAKAAYLAHYDTPSFFGGMKAMAMEEFKRKVLKTLPAGGSIIKSVAGQKPDSNRGRHFTAELLAHHLGEQGHNLSAGDLLRNGGDDWQQADLPTERLGDEDGLTSRPLSDVEGRGDLQAPDGQEPPIVAHPDAKRPWLHKLMSGRETVAAHRSRGAATLPAYVPAGMPEIFGYASHRHPVSPDLRHELPPGSMIAKEDAPEPATAKPHAYVMTTQPLSRATQTRHNLNRMGRNDSRHAGEHPDVRQFVSRHGSEWAERLKAGDAEPEAAAMGEDKSFGGRVVVLFKGLGCAR